MGAVGPAFDEHLGLGATAEPFAVWQFGSQFAVEAFDESVSKNRSGSGCLKAGDF